jgi:SPP1 gp7 family putative phage head morphogenesis protein
MAKRLKSELSAENKDSEPVKKAPLGKSESSPLETDHIFPSIATSDFKSSTWRDSYDFPYNPDPLARSNNYAIYDEMRKDDQIKACLSLKKDMVIGAGWEINSDDEEVKEFFTKDLEDLNDSASVDSSFENCLRDMLSFYEYGFSVSEVVGKLVDGMYHLSAIKTRSAHSWQFDLDAKGDLRKLIQTTGTGDKVLDAKNFLIATYQPEFGNPYGKSDLSSAHDAWKAKKFFQRMFCIYIERFASPTSIARYKAGTQDEEIERIFEMVKTIQNSTVLALPDDVSIDFIQSARDATDGYMKGIDLWNLSIGRALLVPDLLGITGAKTSGGSFSLGQTQFEMFQACVQKDRKMLERLINIRIIQPLAKANFGEDVEVSFHLKPWAQEDTESHLTMWLDAVKAKVYKPGIDEIDHFREAINFPQSPVEIPEAPVMPPGMLPGMPPGMPPGMQPNQPAPNLPAPIDAEVEDGDEDEDGDKPKTDRRAFSRGEKLKLYRDLNSYERKVDFPAIKRTMDSAERSFTKTVTAVQKRIVLDLIEQIKARQILKNFRPESINTLEVKFKREMNDIIKGQFRLLFRDAVNEARHEIIPSGQKHFVEGDIFPDEFEAILDVEAFKMVGDYSADLNKRATNKLIKGIKDGLSEGELVRGLKSELTDFSDRWVSTMVRTKTTEIYNTSRKTLWETDPLIKQIVVAYTFSAVMDDRTSDVCASLDGNVYEVGSFIDRVTPPLHFNCRSILVPVTRFEDYKASKEPTLESLKQKGGGLIVLESNDRITSD